MAEVIEHVSDPERVLREVFRVLMPGGGVYLSVPNRYGWYDPHYHAYFVNWLPRFLAHPFLRLINKEKNLEESDGAGMQRLDTMHYYTYGGISHLVRSIGFTAIDIRKQKIRAMRISKWRRMFYACVYPLVRPVYFDTFHVGLIKKDAPSV